MPLESGTYIDSLNASNPLGTGDPKAQGDDHFRLIKSTIKNTFPNLTGAMNATQAELNRLVGVTGVTGSGSLALSASPTFTGTLTAATVAATTLTGAGSGITALNASNLGSGTIPDARFPSTLPALNGSALTNLNGSNIASGTVADARLSSNVPLKNVSNTFAANVAGSLVQLNQNSSNSASAYSTWRLGGDSGEAYFFLTSAAANPASQGWGSGSFTTQAAGIYSSTPFQMFVNGDLRLLGTGVIDIRPTLSTPNVSAAEVGYKGTPLVTFNSSRALALTDLGKTLLTAHGVTLTLNPDSTTAYPDGSVVVVMGNQSSGSMTIARGSGVSLFWAGTDFTNGDRTASGGAYQFTLVKRASDSWVISGAGLS